MNTDPICLYKPVRFLLSIIRVCITFKRQFLKCLNKCFHDNGFQYLSVKTTVPVEFTVNNQSETFKYFIWVLYLIQLVHIYWIYGISVNCRQNSRETLTMLGFVKKCWRISLCTVSIMSRFSKPRILYLYVSIWSTVWWITSMLNQQVDRHYWL